MFKAPEEDYFYRCGTDKNCQGWYRWFGPPVEVVDQPNFDVEEDRREEWISLSEIALNYTSK